MKVTIALTSERVGPLVNELGIDKVKVIDTTSNGMERVEITIDGALDVLSVYHAGIKWGMDRMKPYTN